VVIIKTYPEKSERKAITRSPYNGKCNYMPIELERIEVFISIYLSKAKPTQIANGSQHNKYIYKYNLQKKLNPNNFTIYIYKYTHI
jgi:hypothetical protein